MGVVICVIGMRAGHLIMLERSIVNQIPVDEFTAAVVVNAPDSEVEAWQELFVPCFDIEQDARPLMESISVQPLTVSVLFSVQM